MKQVVNFLDWLSFSISLHNFLGLKVMCINNFLKNVFEGRKRGKEGEIDGASVSKLKSEFLGRLSSQVC